MSSPCLDCGNPAIRLDNGQVTHVRPGGWLVYPCYSDFGGVFVVRPGSHGRLAEAVAS